MIFAFYFAFLCAEENILYKIETKNFPKRRLTVEKNRIRLKLQETIDAKASSGILEHNLFEILKENDTNTNLGFKIYTGESYISFDNKFNVLIGVERDLNDNSTWEIREIEPNVFEIRKGDECISEHIYDERTLGNYVILKKCMGAPEQQFTIEKVLEHHGIHDILDLKPHLELSHVLKEIQNMKNPPCNNLPLRLITC